MLNTCFNLEDKVSCWLWGFWKVLFYKQQSFVSWLYSEGLRVVVLPVSLTQRAVSVHWSGSNQPGIGYIVGHYMLFTVEVWVSLSVNTVQWTMMNVCNYEGFKSTAKSCCSTVHWSMVARQRNCFGVKHSMRLFSWWSTTAKYSTILFL